MSVKRQRDICAYGILVWLVLSIVLYRVVPQDTLSQFVWYAIPITLAGGVVSLEKRA